MIVTIGKFFFRYRNILGPLVFLMVVVYGKPGYPLGSAALNVIFDVAGVFIAYMGLTLRILTIGYEYIERGGKNRQVYATRLVQGGVFAHCRNPLYVGNLLIAMGLALVVHSALFYFIVLPFIVFSYIAIIAAEEDFLAKKFGAEYFDYCRRVNRWQPNYADWQSSIRGMSFNWRRVIVKEYNTVFLLTLALALIKIWSDFKLIGIDALPTGQKVSIATGIWLALYILVRSLKKLGVLRA